jgi:hypothetical protein
VEAFFAVVGLVGTVAVWTAIFFGRKVFPKPRFGPFASKRMRNAGLVLLGLAAVGWVIGLIAFIQVLEASSESSTTGKYQLLLVGIGCGLALTIAGNLLFQKSRQTNRPLDSGA